MILFNALVRENHGIRFSLHHLREGFINNRKEYFHSLAEAEEQHNKAFMRLMNVNEWNSLLHSSQKKYQLTDSYGNNKTGYAVEGDFVKIAKPGYKNIYNWLVIEKILRVSHNEWESCGLRIRESANPKAENTKSGNLACRHESTILSIERNGHYVTAKVYDHNQLNDSSHNWFKLNALMQLTGLAKNDWNKLIESLLISDDISLKPWYLHWFDILSTSH